MNDVDTTDLLARELRDRCAHVDGHPVCLRDVRATAKAMQRRRRTVTGAVAALFAGFALPSGVALTAALDGGVDVRPAPVVTSPTGRPTPTTEQAVRPAGDVALVLAGAPRGEDAGVDRVEGDLLVRSDGAVVELEREYREIVRAGDGWVGVADAGDGRLERDLVDAEGRVTGTVPSSWGLVTDATGSRVSFVQVENGTWSVFDVLTAAMDPRSPANPGNRPLHPVGYAGEGVLVYVAGEGEDTQVRVFEPSAADYEVPAEPRLIAASGASEATGMVAGMTESRIDGSCWAVVAHDTGRQAFATCDHSLGRFSPSGRHVIGREAYADGLGGRSLAVLDAASGEVLVSFEQPRDGSLVLGEPVWEDDTHVLAPVTDGRDTRVVRFGVDGSLQIASETVLERDFEVPSRVRLAVQP